MIKEEFGTSDTVLGLVTGLAFVLLYSFLGVPIAWLADNWSRRKIIAAGLAFWSLMTALTGYVSSIWQLAIARFLMGAGEACGLAPSNAMIADMFPPSRRTLAMAIFGTSSSIASIAFFPLAGWIAQTYGWRTMFVTMGVPGIFIAVLFLLTVKEPPRQSRVGRTRIGSLSKLLNDIAMLFANRCFVWLFMSVTLMGANVWAAGAWTPTFLARVHGMGLAEIASTIGPIRGIVGAAGILVGGILIDRFVARNRNWQIIAPAIACILVGPAEALFLLSDSLAVALGGFVAVSFFMLIHQGPVFAVTTSIVEQYRRALAVAFLLFGAGFLGNVVGPGAVGILNDVLHPMFGSNAVRYSMLMIAVTPVLAGLCFLRAAQLYQRYAVDVK
jgi:MFS family permease